MLHTTRRKFAFYLGMGLFSLGERLNARALDDWAAATMQAAPLSEPQTPEDEGREHWTPAENSSWTWFERENLVDGQWCLTGITTPVNKHSAEVYYGSGEYLSESLVPDAVRAALRGTAASESRYEEDGDEEGQPSAERRARHGRPPSKWLRSLAPDELRLWLQRIEVPEVGVSGMSFWTHLTRDHSFQEAVVDELSEEEQGKLHAAAHYGY